MTPEQIEDVAALIDSGQYQAVVEVLSAYEQHCREDDCLMGRGDLAVCE